MERLGASFNNCSLFVLKCVIFFMKMLYLFNDILVSLVASKVCHCVKRTK